MTSQKFDASIPIYLRATGLRLAPADRLHIRRKLASKLAKFARSVERASVRLEDVNGPRGRVDHVCRIKVVLRGLPSVVYETRGTSLIPVIERALTGVEQVVRRTVRRRRMAPVRRHARARSR